MRDLNGSDLNDSRDASGDRLDNAALDPQGRTGRCRSCLPYALPRAREK
jgi:hypothetical protein